MGAPAIFGAAAAIREARQPEHSVTIAKRLCAGLLRGISASARTVEAAIRGEDLVGRLVEQVDSLPFHEMRFQPRADRISAATHEVRGHAFA